MIDAIKLPVRDRDDPYDLGVIADDLERTIDDPLERQVQRAVAADLLAGNAPTSMGEALGLLEQAGPEARRALLDRARAEAGLPSLTSEQTAERLAHPPIRASTEPARDGMGRVFAICSEPSCRNFLPDPHGGQIARVAVTRWWCPEHAAGHEGDLQPYTGPRYGYSASGVLIDLDAHDAEVAKEKIRELHRENIAAERDAARAADAERLATFQERRREADLLANRHQIGLRT